MFGFTNDLTKALVQRTDEKLMRGERTMELPTKLRVNFWRNTVGGIRFVMSMIVDWTGSNSDSHLEGFRVSLRDRFENRPKLVGLHATCEGPFICKHGTEFKPLSIKVDDWSEEWRVMNEPIVKRPPPPPPVDPEATGMMDGSSSKFNELEYRTHVNLVEMTILELQRCMGQWSLPKMRMELQNAIIAIRKGIKDARSLPIHVDATLERCEIVNDWMMAPEQTLVLKTTQGNTLRIKVLNAGEGVVHTEVKGGPIEIEGDVVQHGWYVDADPDVPPSRRECRTLTIKDRNARELRLKIHGWERCDDEIEGEVTEQGIVIAEDGQIRIMKIKTLEGREIRLKLRGLYSAPNTSHYLRPEVASFARHMEYILRKNDHKGREYGQYHFASILCFLRKLSEEYAELVEQVSRGSIIMDREKVLKEAIDLANMAMMAAHNYGGLMASRMSEPSFPNQA